MSHTITLNVSNEEQRLTHIATLLHEVSEKLCSLYKRDYIYTKSVDLYKQLVQFNDDLLSKIADKTNEKPVFHFDKIATLPRVSYDEKNKDLDNDLTLLQDIEVTLCEVCERYEAIIENNPYAKSSLKDNFRPLKIEMVSFIKSARKTIYSFL